MSSVWVRTAAVLSFVLSAMPAVGVARTPMPLELAFSHTELAGEEKVSISRDGSRIAYSVNKRPPLSVLTARILPNGSIAASLGRSILTSDTRGGAAKKIAPEGANSWRPSVSPDGSKIAFYCDANGIPQLWLYEVSSGRSRLLNPVKVKPSLWAGDEPIWSEDGERLFVPLAPPEGMYAEPTAKRPGPAEGVPGVVVYRAGRETKAAPMEQEKPQLRPRLMYEQNSTLGVVTVRTGEVREIVPAGATPPPSVMAVAASEKWLAYPSPYKGKSFTWASSWDLGIASVRDGRIAHHIPETVAFAWHPTRDQVFWISDKQLWTVDLSSTSGPRRLAAQIGELTTAPLAVTRDGKAVVVGFDAIDLRETRTDPFAQKLAVVPLEGGKPRTVAIPAGVVFQKLIYQHGTTAWQPETDTLSAIGRDLKRAHEVVLRLNVATGASRVLLRGAKLRLVAATADHQTLFGAFEDFNTPFDVYRFSADLARKTRLSVVEPGFESLQVGSVETFETEAPLFDGSLTKVTSAIVLPPGAKRGDKLPTIVSIYPGRSQTSHAADFGGGQASGLPVTLFTTRGYAILLAAMPLGADGQPGQPSAEAVDVVLPQVYRAIDLGYSDARRLAVTGVSGGGKFTAAMIAGSNLFRAAIAINGNYDFPGSYGWMFPDGHNSLGGLLETGAGRMGTTPWADLQRYTANSPYYQAHRIHTPLLLIHGEIDEICPIEDARKMYSALKRLDRAVQLAEYKDEGHSLQAWALVNAMDAGQRALDFLGAYLR